MRNDRIFNSKIRRSGCAVCGRRRCCCGDCLGFEKDTIMSVMSNIAVQSALCRIHYRRDKHSIPSWDDLEGQAKYWKRVYNTSLGRGTTEHFIEANKKIGFD